jgi:hypothetical protein
VRCPCLTVTKIDWLMHAQLSLCIIVNMLSMVLPPNLTSGIYQTPPLYERIDGGVEWEGDQIECEGLWLLAVLILWILP